MLQKYITRLSPGWLSSLVLLAILWLTLAPDPIGDNPVVLFPHADKLIHFFMFGALAFSFIFDRELLCLHRYQTSGLCPSKRFLPPMLLALVAFIIGGLIELLQIAMDMGRGGDWVDFAADGAGALSALFLAPKIIALLCQR